MSKTEIILKPKPFLKWAGGKGGQLVQLSKYYPSEFNNYFEPFVGGGAVYFSIEHIGKAYINDINTRLMQTYIQIRDRPDEVINSLYEIEKSYKELDDTGRRKFFYEMRDEFNNSDSEPRKSTLLIFLNKTCFNGLYRENRSGEFNVPFGRHSNPTICNEINLRKVSEKLKKATILNTSYTDATKEAKKNDFIYFDPPYFPLNATSSFTSYSKDDFSAADQEDLARLYKELDNKGCKVMLSNSDTKFIRDLYKDFSQIKIKVGRAINANGNGRKKINELVVINY